MERLIRWVPVLLVVAIAAMIGSKGYRLWKTYFATERIGKAAPIQARMAKLLDEEGLPPRAPIDKRPIDCEWLPDGAEVWVRPKAVCFDVKFAGGKKEYWIGWQAPNLELVRERSKQIVEQMSLKSPETRIVLDHLDPDAYFMVIRGPKQEVRIRAWKLLKFAQVSTEINPNSR